MDFVQNDIKNARLWLIDYICKDNMRISWCQDTGLNLRKRRWIELEWDYERYWFEIKESYSFEFKRETMIWILEWTSSMNTFQSVYKSKNDTEMKNDQSHQDLSWNIEAWFQRSVPMMISMNKENSTRGLNSSYGRSYSIACYDQSWI